MRRHAIDPDAYDDGLRHAGLATVTIKLTDPIGDGVSSAIIRACERSSRSAP